MAGFYGQKKLFFAPLLLSSVALFSTLKLNAELMSADELIDLPLEDLMQMDATVVSASKRHELLKNTPAAVYVVSDEDIHRGGATNIPDVLRMVPGVQVARISTSEWAVSARGFNGRFSRYLLVMIDGISIYSSLFSGVNWDEQNISLENIERIEVIRGPAGIMWGANAVNGVVNIITRKPDESDTGALRVTLGDGDEQGSLYGRLDFGVGHNRAFVSGHYQETQSLQLSEDAKFDSTLLNGTARSDNSNNYRIEAGWQREAAGHSIAARFGAFGVEAESLWRVSPLTPPYTGIIQSKDKKQGYFGYIQGDIASGTGDWYWRVSTEDIERDTDAFLWDTLHGDAEVRWNGDIASRHQIVSGISLRYTKTRLEAPLGGLNLVLSPSEQSERTLGFYIQDAIQLSRLVTLTAGARVDKHSEHKTSYKPSLRLMWQPHNHHRFWSGASRALSTPSLILNSNSELVALTAPPRDNVPIPQQIALAGDGKGINSIRLTAYEAGYRFLPSDYFSIDIALFRHKYNAFLSISEEPTVPEQRVENGLPYLFVPILLTADGTRASQGIEAALLYRPTDDWLLQYSGSFIEVESPNQSGVINGALGDGFRSFSFSDASPQWQHSLRSLHTWNQASLEVWLRYADDLKDTPIKAYTALDLHLAYQLTPQLEASLTAKNLFHDGDVELLREFFNASEIAVETYSFLKLEWRFAH